MKKPRERYISDVVKFDLKMKLTLLLLMFFFQVNANTYSQKTKISLNVTNVSIENILLNTIEKKTDYKFFYENEVINLDRKITIKVSKKSIDKILALIFDNTDIQYEILDKQIILTKKTIVPVKIMDTKFSSSTSAISLQQSVQGNVSDTDGIPLPGANIIEKGTINGVQADFDGNFSIQTTSENATLIISFVGYATQEIALNGRSSITVALQEDSAALDEVIVVGYGTQKKASVTGSVSTVNSAELTKVPAPNVNALLAGRLPGLIVNQTNGRPGADTAGISIRGFGANNTNGNSQNEGPLVLVDGFQRSFTQLDPNEIESITILKDASAAVYGVKGGAGVILVTTKRGKIGKPEITFNTSYSIQENANYPGIATYQEYKRAAENHRVGSLAPFFLEDESFQGLITPERRAGLNSGTDPGTNWFDAVTKSSAPMKQNNLNVRGGTEVAKYFISLGYLDQGTIWKSDDFGYKRYNASMNLDVKISNRISASAGFGWRKEDRSSSAAGGNGDLLDISISHPAFPASLPNGSTAGAYPDNPFSPIASTSREIGGYNDTKIDSYDANFKLQYEIPGVTGLIIEGSAAIQQLQTSRKQLEKSYILNYFDGTDYTEQLSQTKTNILLQSSTEFIRLTSQAALRYNNTFGDHNLGALVLYEQVEEFNEVFSATGGDILSGAVPYLFTANPDNISIGGSATEYGRAGVVGRVNYDYKGKYLFEGSLRRDASAYFPKSSRIGYFPGASLGWVISKENFLKNSNTVNFIKLRLSASKLGNDGTNNFDYVEGYSILNRNSAYVFDNQFQTAIRTLGFPNQNITWQDSDLFNVGLDLAFLNNKLGFEFDAFYRNRYNLLARDDESQGIPQTVGVVQPLQNIEERNNRGFEILAKYNDDFGSVKFNSYGTFSWAREKWGKRFVEQEFEDPDLQRLNSFDGEWVNRTFGYLFDGFFRDQAEIDAATVDYDGGAEGNTNIIPGDIKVKDTNGDGVIDQKDQVIIGRSDTPEIIFSLNTQLQWKGFDFTMFWQGAANFEKAFVNEERGIRLTTGGARTPYSYITDNVWTPETADTARFPVDTEGFTNFANIDEYRVDSKYVRLKNLTIGYSIDSKILEKNGFRSLRLYLSGTNLLTFDGLGIYPYDPETADRGTYPVQKIYSMGLNVSF